MMQDLHKAPGFSRRSCDNESRNSNHHTQSYDDAYGCILQFKVSLRGF